MGPIIPEGSLVGVDIGMYNDWSLQCYLIRYYNISVDTKPTENHPFVINRQPFSNPDSTYFIKEDLPLKMFSLFKKVETSLALSLPSMNQQPIK
jgi:hypothetical protein